MTEEELAGKSKQYGAAGYVVPGSSGKIKKFPKRPGTALPKKENPTAKVLRMIQSIKPKRPATALPEKENPTAKVLRMIQSIKPKAPNTPNGLDPAMIKPFPASGRFPAMPGASEGRPFGSLGDGLRKLTGKPLKIREFLQKKKF